MVVKSPRSFPKTTMFQFPVVGPLVFKTLLTVGPGLISGEDTVMGFGFTSCEVMMEMPVGLEGIAGPIVNMLRVIVTWVLLSK